MSPPEDECSDLDPAPRPPNPCGGVIPFEKLSAWPQNAPHGQGAMSLPAVRLLRAISIARSMAG